MLKVLIRLDYKDFVWLYWSYVIITVSYIPWSINSLCSHQEGGRPCDYNLWQLVWSLWWNIYQMRCSVMIEKKWPPAWYCCLIKFRSCYMVPVIKVSGRYEGRLTLQGSNCDLSLGTKARDSMIKLWMREWQWVKTEWEKIWDLERLRLYCLCDLQLAPQSSQMLQHEDNWFHVEQRVGQ